MTTAILILAAGKGTRMKSAMPKVLHPIGQQPMISHVLRTCAALSPQRVAVVVAPGMEAVEKAVQAVEPRAQFAVQAEQKGTGHAVQMALPALEGFSGDVLVVYGDTPLITAESLQHVLSVKQQHKAAIALLAMQPLDPTGYGRVVMSQPPFVERIVECKDASAEEKHISHVWGGVMAFDAEFLRAALPMLAPSPVTGEYYLTALLEMAAADGLISVMALMSEEEAMGVNDRVQLAQAEAVFQDRMRTRMMLSGVTLVAPHTVFFAADTEIGRDTVIRPHVVFGPNVKVGEGCVIGPFAHIRPGSDLGRDVHIGNFVELKATHAGDGAKINHLSYVGDAEVGASANIGAGTITCNYDGYAKHKTVIGERAFIGSNSSLVAPVYVGDGAIVGAGSVVTEDVPSDALYVERAEAVVKEDAAKRVRERNSK